MGSNFAPTASTRAYEPHPPEIRDPASVSVKQGWRHRWTNTFDNLWLDYNNTVRRICAGPGNSGGR
jgi:hypothetical protein